MKEIEIICIGDYFIRRVSEDGGVWISNADGESMQTSEEKLEKMLDEFWDKEF